MGYQCLCFRCRKVFYAGDLSEYVYKQNGHLFCSWSCLRKYEKEQEYYRQQKKKEMAKKYGKKKTVSK